MKKTNAKSYFKHGLALLLVAVMLFSSAPAASYVAMLSNFSVFAHAEEVPVYAAGDTVTFGQYPQSQVTDSALLTTLSQQQADESGKVTVNNVSYVLNQSNWYVCEPVKWRVLEAEEGEYFIVSEDILDCVPYNNTRANVTWETSTLRSWLNDSFYNTCFSETEKDSIVHTAIVNTAVPGYSTVGGNNTEDYVYLLSYQEASSAKYGFSAGYVNDTERFASPSDYALAKGVSSWNKTGTTVGVWWLRSPGKKQNQASDCSRPGSLNYSFTSDVNTTNQGVRPAMRINFALDKPGDENVVSGSCGDWVKWTLNRSTGLLNVRGVGNMYNYTYQNAAPWESYYDDFKKIVFRTGVTSVGDYAFCVDNAASELTLCDTISYMGEGCMFGLDALKTMNYDCANCTLNVGFRVMYPQSQNPYCEYQVYSDNYFVNMRTVNIGDSVINIPENLCAEYPLLSNLKIGANVKTIGDAAFAGDYNIRSLIFPEGLQSIGDSAFGKCWFLEEIVFPESLETIGNSAFEECRSLQEISFPNGLKTIGNWAFYRSAISTVSLPENLTSLGEYAFCDIEELESIDFNAKNCTIGSKAFYECDALKSIHIGDKVEKLHGELFNDCSASVTVTVSGDNPVYHLDSSNMISRKDGTEIAKSFNKDITSFTVPSSVTTIGAYAFASNTQLTSLTVLPNVTSVGTGAIPKLSTLAVYGIPDTAIHTYCTNNQITFCSLQDDDTPPTAQITNVTPSAISATSFTVYAQAADELALKKVCFEYSVDNGATFTKCNEISYNTWQKQATPSYTLSVTDLPSCEIQFRVRVTDYFDNETVSAAVTRTVDHTPPAVPENVSVSCTQDYIRVMWEKETVENDFSYFCVYRSTSPDSGFSKVKQLSTIGYYDDSESGVLADTTYYYYVTAVDTRGNESAPSAIAFGELILDETLPKIVSYTPAANTKAYNKSITITASAWDNYKLSKITFAYRLKNAEGWTKLQDVAVSTKNAVQSYTWDLTSLAAGEYEVCLTATDMAGNVSAQTVIPYTVVQYEAPVAPVLTATNGHRKVQLQWTYSGLKNLASSYTVYRKADGSDTYTRVVSTGQSKYSDVAPVGNYTYKVVVQDIYGATASSNEVAASSLILDEIAPTAYIYMKNPIIVPGRELVFNASYSHDNDVIASYEWNFGDGQTSCQRIVSHSYANPGTYTAVLTVTDAAGNQDSAQITLDVVDVSESSGNRLVNVNVQNSDGSAINGASVVLSKSGSDGTEIVAQTNANGIAEFVLDKGSSYDVYTYKEGSDYTPDSSTLEVPAQVTAGDGQSYVDGAYQKKVILRSDFFTGTVTTHELTPDEIEEAGIDTTKPENQHIYSYSAEFTYESSSSWVAGETTTKTLGITYYCDKEGNILGNDNGEGGWWETGSLDWGTEGSEPYVENGWVCIDEDTYIKPLGGTAASAGQTDSKQYFLKLYGKVGWLKQMFRVDLIVLNSSQDDWMEDCVAELILPDGISLAGMEDYTQMLERQIGKIDKNGQASVSWYVRGDEAGTYDLSVNVTGTIYPEPCEAYDRTFTTEDPLVIQDFKDAVSLSVNAPAVVENGSTYPVAFTLTNTTNKDLYFVTFQAGEEVFEPVTLKAGQQKTFNHDMEFNFSSDSSERITAYLVEQVLICGEVLAQGAGYNHKENGLSMSVYLYEDSACKKEASNMVYTAGSYGIRTGSGAIVSPDSLYLKGTVFSTSDNTVENVTVTLNTPEGFSFAPMALVNQKEIVLSSVTAEGTAFSADIYPIYSSSYESGKRITAVADAGENVNAQETYIIGIDKNNDEGAWRTEGGEKLIGTWKLSDYTASSFVYNAKLAEQLAHLSSAASDEDTVSELLQNYGFKNTEAYNYGTNNTGKKAVYVFATKKIVVNNEVQNLVYVISGEAAMNADGITDFLLADSKNYTDFENNANELKTNLDSYLQKQEKTKLVLAGYGRGAAVINLAAADFDGDKNLFTDKTNVFAYTFAAPNTTNADDANDAKYNNIFNIINPSDLLVYAPFGGAKYGQTLSLPKSSDGNYAELTASVAQRYAALTGESSYKIAKNLRISGLALLLDASSAKPAEYLKSIVQDTPVLLNQVVCAHNMLGYVAWLENASVQVPENQTTQYKVLQVNCPVDVEVYDENGNLVAGVTDDAVNDGSEDGNVFAGTNDSGKVFCLPDDQDYNIQITGNADGVMNYTVSEFDESGDKTRQVNFFDVPVTDGETITGTVNNEMNTAVENYALTMPNMTLLSGTNDLTGNSINALQVSITAAGFGTATGDGSYTEGDRVNLYATPDTDAEFLGWYDGDTLLSTETEYSFIVREDCTLTAKFTGPDFSKTEYYASLCLEENINITFYMENLPSDFDAEKVVITVNGKPVSADSIQYADGNLECTLAAVEPKDIGKNMAIAVTYDGKTVKSFDYSVKKYCEAVFNAYGEYASSTPQGKLVALCKSVLNYGKYAEDKFNDNTESTINAGYEATLVAPSESKKSIQTSETVTAAGAKLNIDSTISMIFYVQSSKPITKDDVIIRNDVLVTVEGKQVYETVDANDIEITASDEVGYNYKITVKNIRAEQMSREYTLTINGDKDFSVTYGVYDYCYEAQTKFADNTTLTSLCKAIYMYGRDAKAFADSISA